MLYKYMIYSLVLGDGDRVLVHHEDQGLPAVLVQSITLRGIISFHE